MTTLSMGLLACGASFFCIPLTPNQHDSNISNTNQGNHKRPLHQEIASAKTAKRFPTVPCTVMSINKLLKYALYTEAKHRVSGKRQAPPNSLKAMCSNHFFFLPGS